MNPVIIFRDTSFRDTISCRRFHTYEVPFGIIPNDSTNTAHTYNLLFSYLSTVAAEDEAPTQETATIADKTASLIATEKEAAIAAELRPQGANN